MSDLVERLRERGDLHDLKRYDELAVEAADEIERLREALATIEREVGSWECDGPDGPTTIGDICLAALKGGGA